MGFNLEMFFDELLRDVKRLDIGSVNIGDDIEKLIEVIEHQKNYAKKCGQLD